MTPHRLWVASLCLYAVAAAADIALHLDQQRRAGHDWLAPAPIVVAISAGFFWPIDLIAQLLQMR